MLTPGVLPLQHTSGRTRADHGNSSDPVPPRHQPARRPRGDNGSGSVLAAIWVCVLAAMGAASVVLLGVLSTRTVAASAADLGALAGAGAALESESFACARAAQVVDANGARLRSCELTGAEVRVEVAIPAPAALAWLLDEHAHAVELTARAHAELTAPDE